MEINFTLVVQMLVFAAFVWFTMKFVWPPLEKALEARRQKIAEGLSAAERAHKELELAQHRATDQLKQAKIDAAQILERANHKVSHILDEAKQQAQLEAEKILKIAREQIAQEVMQAREVLKQKVGRLAIEGAQKILQREVDEIAHRDLVNQLIEEL